MQNGVSKWRRIKWQYETPNRSMAPTGILRQQRKERWDKETIDPNSKMAAGALIESSYCGLPGWSSWWNGSCKDQPGAEMQSRWNKENPEGLICRLVNFWLLLKHTHRPPPPTLHFQANWISHGVLFSHSAPHCSTQYRFLFQVLRDLQIWIP